MRSCPRSGFSMAILRISLRSFSKIVGRPGLLFQNQGFANSFGASEPWWRTDNGQRLAPIEKAR